MIEMNRAQTRDKSDPIKILEHHLKTPTGGLAELPLTESQKRTYAAKRIRSEPRIKDSCYVDP
jgi:hypothetical protein